MPVTKDSRALPPFLATSKRSASAKSASQGNAERSLLEYTPAGYQMDWSRADLCRFLAARGWHSPEGLCLCMEFREMSAVRPSVPPDRITQAPVPRCNSLYLLN